ncbi:hypothetical protein AKJ42_02460, partial [candidate division MSBL1 archaeon SCGC-AAA261C02]
MLVFPLKKITAPRRLKYELGPKWTRSSDSLYFPVISARIMKGDGTYSEKLLSFILDSGAMMSVLSKKLAEHLNLETFGKCEISGAVLKKECRIPAKLSKIKMKLVDERGKLSPELNLTAAVPEIDEVPSVISLNDLMGRFEISMNSREKKINFILFEENS